MALNVIFSVILILVYLISHNCLCVKDEVILNDCENIYFGMDNIFKIFEMYYQEISLKDIGTTYGGISKEQKS